ncbi:MAG TPA: YkgJ family cysteine cluster protein [Azonexus sp.]|nr:YkgJ family cysteine cluster protein [Azonexus sp.]
MSKTQIPLPQSDGRVFYDMAAEDNPCFGCGACCYHYRVSFYHGELDTQPGGFVPSELTSPVTPFLACMRGTQSGQGRCIALRDDGRCAIYNQRPSTCREFRAFQEDGLRHPECERLRQLYGIEPAST